MNTTTIDFDALYHQHSEEIRRYVRGIVPEQADDLTQETFFRAWRALHTFRGTNIRAWLYQIAGNAARDLYRHNKLIQFDPIEKAADITTPDDALLNNLDFQNIMKAMRRIPNPTQRAALLMYSAGYDFPEIALRLNVRPSSIKCLVQRAREALQQMLVA